MAIKDGVKSIYYALMTDDKLETYGEVKKLGELVEFSLASQVNTTNKFAGNALYASVKSMSEMTLNFTIPEISLEDYKSLFNYEADEKYGGVIVTNSTSLPYVAIMVEETAGDVTIYHHFYKGVLAPSEIGGKTSEGGVQFNDVSFTGTFMPMQTIVDANGKNLCRFELHSDDPKYATSDFKTKWGKEVIKVLSAV